MGGGAMCVRVCVCVCVCVCASCDPYPTSSIIKPRLAGPDCMGVLPVLGPGGEGQS